jgi:hypothetical protein
MTSCTKCGEEITPCEPQAAAPVDINAEIQKHIDKQIIIEHIFWSWYQVEFKACSSDLDRLALTIMAQVYANRLNVKYEEPFPTSFDPITRPKK